MAKTTDKPAVKRGSRVSASKKNGSDGKVNLIEKVNREALEKLKTINGNEQLQADIEWCLGSYSYDKNPVGLYEMAKRALKVFQEEKSKNARAVPSKLISDLEKAISAAQ